MMKREYNRMYYGGVDGNAARQLEAVPKRRRVERPGQEPGKRSSRKALPLNAGYALFLAAAAVVCLIVCLKYIGIESQISERNASINTLTKDISVLASQNDTMEYSIESFKDFRNICKIAKDELGMIPATKEQVFMYDKDKSDYMRQTEDVPDE